MREGQGWGPSYLPLCLCQPAPALVGWTWSGAHLCRGEAEVELPPYVLSQDEHVWAAGGEGRHVWALPCLERVAEALR